MVEHNIVPNAFTYKVLIYGIFKICKVQEPKRFLIAMLKGRFIPGIDFFNILIVKHFKEGNIKEAFELYSRMERQRLVPDIVAFTNVMDKLCKIGKWKNRLFLQWLFIGPSLLHFIEQIFSS